MVLFWTLMLCVLLAIGAVVAVGVIFYWLTESILVSVFLAAVVGCFLAMVFFS